MASLRFHVKNLAVGAAGLAITEAGWSLERASSELHAVNEVLMNTTQKLGVGSALAAIGGLGIVLIPVLGWSPVGSPWDFILGFLFGVSAGAGAALAIAGLLERRSG